MHSPPDALDAADHGFPDTDARAPLSLGFRVRASPKAALCLRVDFGDSSGVQVTIYNVSRGIAVTAYHQFRKEGVYVLKALIYNDLCGPGRELGPYYVEMGPATMSVFMNSSSIRRDELLVFAGSHADQKSTVVTHHFAAGPPCNVSFTCQSCAAGGQAWPSVTVQYRMQPVSVYTNGTMFATDIDITFLAVTEETAPLEFVWSFGEGPALRTTSRSIKRRLSIPQWYSVTVQAASRLGRVASEPRRIRTQRRIVANRLVSPLSALLNASVTFTCRLNFGTNVAFLWDFGDGTVGPGGSSAHHTYQREGQFTVQVRAFNDVSAVSLAKQLFVVREPCQPPPVKNMGPGKVQVWRSQPVTLGVTFESAILCDISQGLSYTWTIRTSEGWPVPLPPGVSTRRQTITVPGYFLELGNYTALARVQVDGSVVHSNYSVGVEVRARAPVSVISEGTQLFISRAPSVTIILSGSQSYDPDNPGATLRYHWTCTAAGAPGEPCFTASSPHSLRAGAPSLSFPASSLSNSYDQFLVTLTVSSAGRNSSEAQVFLSPRPDTALRFVHISRGSFKDALVNWNEELSLRAECDACAAGPRLSYSWDLFLVNATEGTRTDGTAPAALASPTRGGRGLRSRGRRGLAQTHVPAVPSGGRDHAGAPPAGPFPRPVGFSEPKSGGRGGADEQIAGARVAAQQRVSPSIARQSRCDGSEESRSDPVEILSRNSRQRCLGPFCRAVGLLGAAGLGADSMQLPSSAPSTAASCPEPRGTGVASSQKQSPQPRVQPGPSLPGTPSLGPVDTHPLPDAGDAAFPGLARRFAGSPGTWSPWSPSPSPSDFEADYGDIQEAVPPTGRQPAHCESLPGADPSSSPGGGQGDGDNLLGPLRPAARPALMVDWPKAPVGRALFRSYTASGITGHAVTIKPFSLSPGETYVVQASVASTRGLLGRAQLYLTLHPAPRDVACQVQPHRGLEAHTVFSIFCMAMRPDFRYKFSYRIGNASKHTLYHGRDTQYYFVLPAGEPSDNYKVMVSTEITDGVGSRTLPCAVAVTVLPHFHGSLCLDEDTYNSSLKHLSTLQLMGSYTEIRNYITTITRVLSRWAAEDRSPSCGQWSRIQDALISSACGLPVADQEDMTHSVLMLRGLLRFPRKLSFRSAALILKSARAPLAQSPLSGRLAVDKGLMLELILLISEVLEASDWEKPRNSGFLQEEGTKIISDLLLDGLSASTEHQLHVSAGQMEFRTRLHHDLQSSVQSLGSVQVHLPADLAAQSPVGAVQGPCYISQLMLFKKNLYPWGRGPGQIGQVVSASLFGCSSRRPVGGWRLRAPVAVEFGEEGGLDNGRTRTAFVLLRDRVNVHEFTGAATPRESLHIRIEFFRPPSGAFPVMVLVRFSEKPTPSAFLVKKVYVWDEQPVHLHIPAGPLRDLSLGYLSLLDADYDRSPRNRYSAKAVNYTVRFHWLQCVVWEAGEWRPASSSPQPGVSPGKVNCSHDRLAPVSISRRSPNATFSASDISELQRHPENLLPGVLIVVFTILYALLVTKSRRVDCHERKKAGYIFLQEDAPPGHQLYAVVVDTGFRSPTRCSAKVYIVLCGEHGLSGPRELYCPEQPLFERNSRHTFVLSVPALLGPLRRICLWHDSRGPAPAWYVSHIMVKELASGPGHSWLFPAECWLAASGRDGHTAWELGSLRRGLGFWKLLYCKFTEYLEDFHVWTSVYSRPSPSGFLPTARLTVAFALLCAYACLTALVTAAGQEQVGGATFSGSGFRLPDSRCDSCSAQGSAGSQFYKSSGQKQQGGVPKATLAQGMPACGWQCGLTAPHVTQTLLRICMGGWWQAGGGGARGSALLQKRSTTLGRWKYSHSPLMLTSWPFAGPPFAGTLVRDPQIGVRQRIQQRARCAHLKARAMTPTHSGDLSTSLQLAWALSAPDAASAGSLWTGLLGTLLASPGAQLLSLLFRLSQVRQPVHAPCSPVLLRRGAPALTAASLVQDAGGPSRVNACQSRSPLVGAAPGPNPRGGTTEAGKRREGSLVSGSSGACRRAARGDGAGCPPPEREDLGADAAQRARREKGSPGAQGADGDVGAGGGVTSGRACSDVRAGGPVSSGPGGDPLQLRQGAGGGEGAAGQRWHGVPGAGAGAGACGGSSEPPAPGARGPRRQLRARVWTRVSRGAQAAEAPGSAARPGERGGRLAPTAQQAHWAHTRDVGGPVTTCSAPQNVPPGPCKRRLPPHAPCPENVRQWGRAHAGCLPLATAHPRRAGTPLHSVWPVKGPYLWKPFRATQEPFMSTPMALPWTGRQPHAWLEVMPLPCSPAAASSGFGGVAVLRWPWALLPWSGSAAWVLCGTVSVACGLGTAFLGYRFNPTQCVRWLYLLAASVLCCVLVTQPLLVSLLALGFAWRRRHDPHFFTEALHAATKDLGPELEARARPHPPHCASQKEEVLAARQRARHLRRARPPSAAQLSAVRQKLRRQTRTRRALRDMCMFTLLLLLHLLILCRTGSRDAHSLHHAIRTEFTRGASSASGGLGSVADWWGWTLTTLLDGLHGGGAPPARPPGTQPRALGGTCYLLGSLVIRQLRWPSGSAGQLPSRAPALPEDPPPEVGGPDGAPVTEPATPGDSRGCGSREPWELSLGSTRPAAHAVLSGLRAGGWIDGGTSAVSVHFVLYNCPTRLLSSVALHAELLPAGGLALAPLVESVAAFHSDSGLWHRLALPELAFLVLSLTQSCLQLHRAAQEGVHSYWGEPGSWLELAIAGAGLARYAASCHLATVAGAVTDRLHRGHFRGSMDLSLAASWSQVRRGVRGHSVGRADAARGDSSCTSLKVQGAVRPLPAFPSPANSRSCEARLSSGDHGLVANTHAPMQRGGLAPRKEPYKDRSAETEAQTGQPARSEPCRPASSWPSQGPGLAAASRLVLTPRPAPAVQMVASRPADVTPSGHPPVGRAPGAGLAGARASCTLAGRGDPLTGSVLLSQRVMWLQGTLSFLLTLKCVHLVSIRGTTASCSFLMRRSLASAFAAALAGVLALAAHSHLRAVPPGTLTDFSRGPRSRLSRSDLQAPAWCCGALFMVMSTAWLGMLRGSFTTLAQRRKSFQSQSVVRLADVTAYVRTEALAWLGLERPQQEEAEMVESHNYYLDDVSDLLDELLSKIHALSDSLQLPLPEQQFCDMREARAKGHSSAGISA
ncbi:polycystin-1-like protein 1 [Canis lupus baileyi]|uniref:polycystin-1-like protein 1 n=1 Tax=Canis lupus baileyi TaxID=143281 RepID=UPI003B97872D